MKKYFVAPALLLASLSCQAELIGFEDGLSPLFTYSDVTYSSDYYGYAGEDDTGYNSVIDFTESKAHVYNGYEASPSDFIWSDVDGSFDLGSFVIAGAWGNQTLTIEGFNDGALLYSELLDVTIEAFEAIFNWSGIDQFRINIDPNGYVHTAEASGSGQHWALDNIKVNEFVSKDVPAPAAIFLAMLAGIGLLSARRR
ncbi:hypothetical protein EZV61_01740 [Corallincola luteus]|uniref:PEP-CTERM sorting domain-containing protein n=1 Tax=Corallincola luteus TaxID=1775177 RepID=A0ABY2AQ62_9GAMM|nr:hypothetical protein [Corallincola luteus]TCI04718.1 hypothetical protein EZV61_01740 [Corallincola luteus]